MDALLGIVTFIGHAIEAVLAYVESHHWIFGLLALGYIWRERFRAKWVPVRVKKTRQNKNLEPPFRFNRNGKSSRNSH